MEDCQIIDLYWNRSEAAITETSRKFGGFCRSIAMHILDNAEDAEECINDAFLAAWNTIPPQRPKKLSAFLGRITRNIALDRYDYNTAQKRNRQFHCILDELEECLAAGLDTEAEYESQQIAQVIRLFLEGCNTENRNIFLR
ncbi:MAG TPA: sigma-70 family RNA polymerase sigma factor, partial [Firmicutes bacterium]|nr:sigma-70 family RNA polymerase sigma factor [Bacillota bacterium]